MFEFQAPLFRWATEQGGITGLVMFLVGMVFVFQGFRFASVMLPLCSGVVGYGIGLYVAPFLTLEPLYAGFGAAAVLALLSSFPPLGRILSSTLVLGALGHYMAVQLGLAPLLGWTLTGIAAAYGLALAYIARFTLALVVTAILGAGVALVGFVAVTAFAAPGLGNTFRSVADDYELVVPVLIGMLWVMGYAYQLNQLQGDMRSGTYEAPTA